MIGCLQAAFVPQTDGVDDTSYFVSRYGLSGVQDDEDCNDSASDTSEFSSNFGPEVSYVLHVIIHLSKYTQYSLYQHVVSFHNQLWKLFFPFT